MKKLILALLVAAAVAGCKKNAAKIPAEIEKAQWLLGNWEQQTPQGNLYENWKQINDSLYNAESFFIKGKDTLFSETVALTQSGKNILYTVSVKGQNDGLPVAFKMTTATVNELIFENPSHDFPNKIAYKQIAKDSLVASIYGVRDGKPVSESYAMRKVE